MKTMGLVLIAGVTLAAALAATFGAWHQRDPAIASPLVVMGIDMDPSGNSCPGTGTADCTLGSIETCRSVPNAAGTTFTVDTFVQGLTNGFEAWSYNLEFPDMPTGANLTVTGQTETSSTLNLSVQSVDSSPVPTSEEVPDSGTPHTESVADFGTSELTPPFTQGVLARLEFTVGEGATSGLYGLTLPPIFATALDMNGNTYVVDQIWDATFTPQYGLIALGEDCPPAPTFTPTPSATATPTPTASPTISPTATPPPGTVTLVAGWNDSCYQGQVQPVADAFAAILAGVEAVYRMNADQTFGRWFPTRPELSTITTLNPFDQLLILTSSNATWTVQSLAPLPSSTPLNTGWNSVCYLGGGKDTATAATGISGVFSIIYSLPPDQVWRRYVSGRPELSDLARLETFTSVLILMTDPAGGTWAFSP